MVTDIQVMNTLARMPPESRALFDILPLKFQEAYLTFWETRPDPHGGHRDTLPAFIAGVFVTLS